MKFMTEKTLVCKLLFSENIAKPFTCKYVVNPFILLLSLTTIESIVTLNGMYNTGKYHITQFTKFTNSQIMTKNVIGV